MEIRGFPRIVKIGTNENIVIRVTSTRERERERDAMNQLRARERGLGVHPK